MMQYKLLTDTNPKSLEVNINQLLNAGWQLYGGSFAASTYNSILYAQALVKHDSPNRLPDPQKVPYTATDQEYEESKRVRDWLLSNGAPLALGSAVQRGYVTKNQGRIVGAGEYYRLPSLTLDQFRSLCGNPKYTILIRGVGVVGKAKLREICAPYAQQMKETN